MRRSRVRIRIGVAASSDCTVRSSTMPDASIRPETAADHDAIDRVVGGAFPSDAEAKLVHALRASREYIAELALVAIVDGTVVGHVMVSRAELHRDGAVHEIAILAPLAVHP